MQYFRSSLKVVTGVTAWVINADDKCPTNFIQKRVYIDSLIKYILEFCAKEKLKDQETKAF